MSIEFPDPSEALEDGLLAIGGDLEVETLLSAYSKGIFPWPIPGYPLPWFSPDPRGVLFYEDLHISRSLKKSIRNKNYEIKFNEDFDQIIKLCKESLNRKDQVDTWITNQLKLGYMKLFIAGNAHCVGAYLDGKLVGGLYGVTIGEFYSGESMFYLETDASKVCLVALMEELHRKGINYLDTQMVTPLTESMGAVEIPREDFLELLSQSLATTN